jgi:hypothetical protein
VPIGWAGLAPDHLWRREESFTPAGNRTQISLLYVQAVLKSWIAIFIDNLSVSRPTV